MDQQKQKPVAAGKSSYDLLEPERLWSAVRPWQYPVIVDAGCGVGNYTRALSGQAPDACILACDLWRAGITELRKSLDASERERIHPLVADLCGGLPLGSGLVDGVLMATVLHDLAHDGGCQSVLTEVRRALRPGGRFWVVEFVAEPTPKGPPVEIRLAPADVAEMAASEGFRSLEPVRLGESLYLLTLVAEG